MAIQIQLRRATSGQWTAANTILADGEIGYESDTGKIKIGNGTSGWTSISYWTGGGSYQPTDADLTAIAALTGTGLLRRTGTDTWVLDDPSTYLTSATASSTYLTQTNAANDYQPKDADLSSIASLSGSYGYLKKTAENTWGIDSNTFINTSSTPQTKFGNFTVDGDLVTTNLTVTGTQNIINTSNLSISDPLIYLSNSQFNTDTVDIGIYGAYGDINPGNFYTGLIRDHTDGAWHLFSNGAEPTGNIVSLAGVVYDTLHLGAIQVESTAIVTNLNADKLDGQDGSYYAAASSLSSYLTTASASSTYLTQENASSTYLTISGASSSYQPLDGDLTAIAGLVGTSGILTKTALNTWSLDTTTYLSTATAASTYAPIASPTFTGTVTGPRFVANVGTTGASSQGAFAYGTLGFSDQNVLASFVSGVNTYAQVVIQNTNNTASASADFVITNNRGSSAAYYGNFGMNSQSWAGTGAFDSPDNVYLTSTTSDLAIGTTTANAIRFAVNGSTTDAMTISATGDTTFTGIVRGVEETLPFVRTGPLSITTGSLRYRFPWAATILGVTAAIGTAPQGAAVIADVNKNGITIFTTQANRPTIAAAANATTTEPIPNVTAMAAGDYLTVDIDQVGSTTAGSDITVIIRFERA